MVTQGDFEGILLPVLPEEYKVKAQELFTLCGEDFSDHVANSLVNALEKKRVPMALERIESIYKEHIEKIEPDMRCISVLTIGPECFTMLNRDLLAEEETEADCGESEPPKGTPSPFF